MKSRSRRDFLEMAGAAFCAAGVVVTFGDGGPSGPSPRRAASTTAFAIDSTGRLIEVTDRYAGEFGGGRLARTSQSFE